MSSHGRIHFFLGMQQTQNQIQTVWEFETGFELTLSGRWYKGYTTYFPVRKTFVPH